MVEIEELKKSIEKLDELDISGRLILVDNIRNVLKQDPRNQTIEICYQALLKLTEDKKWEIRKAVAESTRYFHEKHRFDELIKVLLKDQYPYVKKSALYQKKQWDKSFGSKVENEKVRKETKDLLTNFAKTHSKSEVDELRKLSKMLYNEMISVTRHKLKNIILPIDWYITDLNEAFEKSGITDDNLEKTKHNAMLYLMYLKEIMNEFGEIIIDPKSINFTKVKFQDILNEVIEEVLKTIKQESGENDVEFIVNVEENLVVEISRPKMYDTLFNIIKNGIEEQETEKRIEIKAYTNNGSVIIQIIDYGKGFKNIFSYYYPGLSDKGKGPGSGYGIITSINNIHNHHGSIEIDDIPEIGTKTIIKIPKEQRHG